MSGFRKLIVAAVACAFSQASGYAKNINVDFDAIDLSKRIVPFEVTSDGQASSSLGEYSALPSSKLDASFSLPSLTSSTVFALQIPGDRPARIELNADGIDQIPLPRADGNLYLIDGGMLHPGVNNLSVARKNGSVESWSGTRIFSLLSHFEEDHPRVAFGPKSETEVSKAITPLQVEPAPDQENYDVQSYDCWWKPSFVTQSLTTATVTIGARATIPNFTQAVLDFDTNGGAMVIDSITNQAGNPLTYSLNTAEYQLLVNLSQPIAAGADFTIVVTYHGTPSTSFPKMLFGTTPFNLDSRNGTPIVFSASQPYGGRRWWPCKDTPADKATTSVTHIVVPNAYNAVSNGALVSTIPNGDGTTTYNWRNDHPIATYLISLAATNYVYYGGTYTSRDGLTTMPVGHFIFPNSPNSEKTGYQGTIQVLSFYADMFGEYPYLDDKYETAAWTFGFGIEHQTCTGIPSGSSSGVGNGFTRRNVHELSHQWFGDKITCASWDDVWLNEGFATFCEALVTEHFGVFGSYDDYVLSWTPSRTVPVVNPNGDDFADSVVYDKGGWVLHMLRHVLGDAKFFQALRDYIAIGYTTVSSQPPGQPVAFQSAMEQSAGLSSGSLSIFFDEWLHGYQGGTYSDRPNYGIKGNLTLGSPNQITLSVYQNQAGTPYTMPVDVLLDNGVGQTTTVVVSSTAALNTQNFNLGSFVPRTATLDPGNWILNDNSASINSVSLPSAASGIAYSTTIVGLSDSTPLTWSLRNGAPSWLSLSSGGILSGMPPTGNVAYSVPVRMTDNSGITRDADLPLMVTTPVPPPTVVINEVNYDIYGATNAGEYIELKNIGATDQDISGCQLVLVNASGASYGPSPITIPQNTILAHGAYYVIGNAATINAVYTGVVNLNVNLDNQIASGTPDGIILQTSLGTRVDSVAYRADVAFGGGAYASAAAAEGGTGYTVGRLLGTPNSATLGRLPDGIDTESNFSDFANIPPSPGTANSNGFTLPFTDDFTTGVSPAWLAAFRNPTTVVSAGDSGAPGVASPSGGSFLQVVDFTGGGDVNYLSGSFNQLNFTGYLWIPQSVTTNGWSTGVGVGSRSESAWFSTTAGYGLENGFYLEYENGPLGGALKGGQVPPVAGSLRLLAVQSWSSVGSGVGSAGVATIGSATVIPGSWIPFRLAFDRVNNHLIGATGDTVLYDGTIPFGQFPPGGAVVGFRENHSGNPSTANAEATFVDHVRIDADTQTNSGIADYEIY